MKSPALSFTALDAVVGQFPDDSLVASREAALAQLRKSGIPNVREEDWKYTDFTSVVDIANEWLASGDEEAPREETGTVTGTIDADWLVIENGRPRGKLSIDGVTVRRLSEAGIAVSPVGRLGHLNVALLHDGLHIAINEGVELSRPLGILVGDHASSAAGMSQVRIDIDAAPDSKADIIVFHQSGGSAAHFANAVVNLSVQDGAKSTWSASRTAVMNTARPAISLPPLAVTPHSATPPSTSAAG